MVSSKSNASASSAPGARARRAGSWVRRATGLAVVAVLLAAMPLAAHAARKRVVVLGFRGPKAARFEDAVVKVLKKTAHVIPARTYSRMKKRVHGYHPDAEGMSKVARKLHANAIISGRVARHHGRYRLTISIRAGATGEEVGDPIVVTVHGSRIRGAAERKLKRDLRAALRDLPDARAHVAEADRGGDSDAGDTGGAGAAAAGSGDQPDDANGSDQPAGDDQGAAGGGSEQAGGDSDPPQRTAAAEDAGDNDSRPSHKSSGSVSKKATHMSGSEKDDLEARGRALELSAGISFQGRKLSFSYDGALTGAEAPQGYSGGLVPGVYVAGELYPMTLIKGEARKLTHNIGLSFVLDKVLLIKSKLQSDSSVSLPTSQTRYGVGLVYRWNFGSRPTSPTLKLGVGYNKLSFTIDESGAPAGTTVLIPDVAYTYIDPGVVLRYPFSAKLAAIGEARYLLVTATGQIQKMDQYGAGSSSGYDIDLGGEYKLTSRLMVRAGIRLMHVGLSFDGSGALTDRNMDSMQDVSSASDRYMGIYATAGYLF